MKNVTLTLQLSGRGRRKNDKSQAYFTKQYPMPEDVVADDDILKHLCFKPNANSKECIMCHFLGYDSETRLARYVLTCAKSNMPKFREMLKALGWELGIDIEHWLLFISEKKVEAEIKAE